MVASSISRLCACASFRRRTPRPTKIANMRAPAIGSTKNCSGVSPGGMAPRLMVAMPSCGPVTTMPTASAANSQPNVRCKFGIPRSDQRALQHAAEHPDGHQDRVQQDEWRQRRTFEARLAQIEARREAGKSRHRHRQHHAGVEPAVTAHAGRMHGHRRHGFPRRMGRCRAGPACATAGPPGVDAAGQPARLCGKSFRAKCQRYQRP